MTEWWQEGELRQDLEEGLTHFNRAARSRESDAILACDEAFKGLNRLWNALARLGLDARLDDDERGDTGEFVAMMLRIPEARQRSLLEEESTSALAELDPILNHWVLSRDKTYRPGKPLSTGLQERASREHVEFVEELTRWQETQGSPRRAVRTLTRLLYVVRSNIAHGWKTPHGPDWEQESRDRSVAGRVYPAVLQLFETVLKNPRRRLASYGSLRPGEVNEAVLQQSGGSWMPGSVRGRVVERNGLKVLEHPREEVSTPVDVFETSEDTLEWSMLDRFEGTSRYQRVWVVVQLELGYLTVANAYVEAG
jgi:gamma-glutamylcyclotransferase (GGCT)/AIG2-like uncharacterized protein YtfP